MTNRIDINMTLVNGRIQLSLKGKDSDLVRTGLSAKDATALLAVRDGEADEVKSAFGFVTGFDPENRPIRIRQDFWLKLDELFKENNIKHPQNAILRFHYDKKEYALIGWDFLKQKERALAGRKGSIGYKVPEMVILTGTVLVIASMGFISLNSTLAAGMGIAAAVLVVSALMAVVLHKENRRTRFGIKDLGWDYSQHGSRLFGEITKKDSNDGDRPSQDAQAI